MFCTLKEAAAWLRTSESDLRTMLADGVLREYRDGANRLLRIADVRTLAAARFSDDQPYQRPAASVDKDLPGNDDHLPAEAYVPDIRLPRSGTVMIEAPVRQTSTVHRSDSSESSFASSVAPRTHSVSGPSGPDPDLSRERREPCRRRETGTTRTRANDYAPLPAWPRPRVERTSVRKGLWTGVVEDRPSAIITVLILAIGVVSALAAGVYTLIKFLK
jgi:excisionase family DNA binding protein